MNLGNYEICDALHDLVPFVQFKKREKHPWRSVTFILKVTLLHGCFSRFLNSTSAIKSRNASHIIRIIIVVYLSEQVSSVRGKTTELRNSKHPFEENQRNG